MRAVCWEGKGKIQVETVPDPVILNPRDAIIKVTTTAICGSDLHIYDGYIPTMHKGDVLGHEFMGEVVEVGKNNTRLRVGDRVVVPFTIACGQCYFCKEQLWSLCDNSNPNSWMAEKLYGYSGSGLFSRWARRTCTSTCPACSSASNAARSTHPSSFTHRIDLEDAPGMYRTFRDKHDSCIKVVMKPGRPAHHHTDPPRV